MERMFTSTEIDRINTIKDSIQSIGQERNLSIQQTGGGSTLMIGLVFRHTLGGHAESLAGFAPEGKLDPSATMAALREKRKPGIYNGFLIRGSLNGLFLANSIVGFEPHKPSTYNYSALAVRPGETGVLNIAEVKESLALSAKDNQAGTKFEEYTFYSEPSHLFFKGLLNIVRERLQPLL